MQIVIPCGGFATRLGALAKDTPKVLMNVNGRAFIEWQLDLIKKHDFDEVVLCIGHLGEKIQSFVGDGAKYGITIKYSHDTQLGVIGAIKNAERLLKNHFFMMYGDSYLPKLDFNDMYKQFGYQNKLAMMSVWKNNNKIEPSNINVKDNEVISVGEPNSEYIDYGAIIFDKSVLKFITKDTFFSSKDLLKILSKKRQIAAYEMKSRFYDIGNPERLKELEDLLRLC